jgi:hypothetical protein
MTDNDKGTRLLPYIFLTVILIPLLNTGAFIIKLFTTIMNSITKKASVFVKASQKLLTKTKALGYYTTEFLTAILIPSLNTGGPYHKPFYNCNEFCKKKASVFVKTSQTRLTITKAIGYYTMEFLTAVLIPSLNTLDQYHKLFYGQNEFCNKES